MAFLDTLTNKPAPVAGDKILISDSADSNNEKNANLSSLKPSMGLDQVDNTADTDKPVSTAQQSAITSAVAGVSTGGGQAAAVAVLSMDSPTTPSWTVSASYENVDLFDSKLTSRNIGVIADPPSQSLTFMESGSYRVEIELEVEHDSNGSARTFNARLYDLALGQAVGSVNVVEVAASTTSTKAHFVFYQDIHASLLTNRIILQVGGVDVVTTAEWQTARISATLEKSFGSSITIGNSHLTFSGDTGNYVETAHTAASALTNNVDVRVHVCPTDPASGSSQSLFSKYRADANRAWFFGFNGTGNLLFQYSTDGSNSTARASSVTPTWPDDNWLWLRATFISGVVTFYTSADGVAWSQLGTASAAGGTPLHSSISPVQVGGIYDGTTLFFDGKIDRAILANSSTGETIIDVDADVQEAAQTKFITASKNTCVIESAGANPTVLAPSEIKLRVATWNVYLALGNSGGSKFIEGSKAMDRILPDVLVMQELVVGDLPVNVPAFAAANGFTHTYLSGAGRLYNTAILSKYPLTNGQDLSSTPPANEWQWLPSYAVIDVGHPTKNIGVMGIHGVYRGAGLEDQTNYQNNISWKRQKAFIETQKAADSTLEFVIAGDWNWSPEYVIAEEWASAVDGNGFVTDAAETFPFTGQRDPANQARNLGLALAAGKNLDGDPNTLWATTPNPANTEAKPLDFIAYSSGIQLVGAEVLDSEAEQIGGLPKYGAILATGHSRLVSDHKIVFADVTLK